MSKDFILIRMNIVYASDHNLEDIATVSIISLLENNKDEEINIYFLDAGVSDMFKDNFAKFIANRYLGVKIIFIDVKQYLGKLVGIMPAMGQSYGTYSRLFIVEILPGEIDTCLYIDCDTIVNSYIGDIFNGRHDFPIYMCYDMMSVNHKNQIGLCKDDPYFNAGILLLNLDSLRELGFSSFVKNEIKTNHNYRFHDQDILNVILKGNIGVLPLFYNVQSPYYFFRTSKLCCFAFDMVEDIFYKEQEYSEALSEPRIVHFTSVHIIPRPWFKNSNHPRKDVFNKYASLIPWETHFYEKVLPMAARQRFLKMCYDSFSPNLSSVIISLIHRVFNKLYKY